MSAQDKPVAPVAEAKPVAPAAEAKPVATAKDSHDDVLKYASEGTPDAFEKVKKLFSNPEETATFLKSSADQLVNKTVPELREKMAEALKGFKENENTVHAKEAMHKASSEISEAWTKSGGLNKQFGSDLVEIIQKHASSFQTKSKDAIWTESEELKKAIGPKMEEIKKLASEHGEEGKKSIEELYTKIQTIVKDAGGYSKESVEKVSKAVEEKLNEFKTSK